MQLDSILSERLKADGWSLNEKAVAQQIEEILPSSTESGKQPTHQDVLKAILDLDLKQVGAPGLPEDINRADSRKLVGPHVLQLVEATDISRPTKFQETIPEDRKNRLLRLRLTDGSKTCIAIEYASLPGLNTKQLIPGVKIIIQNALIRVGSLLLDSSKSVSVLGGRVERLAAAWEVQQLYGGTAERSSTSTSTGATKDTTPADSSILTTKPDKPLPFKHFDAKASSSGHEKMKRALAAVAVPTVSVVVQAVGGKNTGPNSQHANKSSRDFLPPGIAASSTNQTTTTTNDAAKSKLLERLSAHEDAHGRHGRGRRRGGGGGRGGRRGRFHNGEDDGEDGSMTLEEWEAKKKGGVKLEEKKSDEQLARELQRQLDLEDMRTGDIDKKPRDVGSVRNNNSNNDNTNLQSELLGMFSYDQKEEEYLSGDAHRTGRGRGRERGRRGGRGRGGGGSSGNSARGGGRSNNRGRPSRGRGRDGGRA